ncbi:hypothetical protein [Speluncibacter jeojiensis]|uniref:Uncharacterized protein n=1 Tax=Speluncibacter jeojiensis TaxID=2710754 RepID=A0A9X4RCY1_9ACTN|nr:hypothetical protein [Corynebacteriales bacterium D3-21]
MEAVTFFGGSAAAALIQKVGNRKHSEVIIEKDRASAVQLLTDAVTSLGARVSTLEGDLQQTREELATSQQEQTRVTGLFHQAVSVIRDAFDILRANNIPAPKISDDLEAEIERST